MVWKTFDPAHWEQRALQYEEVMLDAAVEFEEEFDSWRDLVAVYKDIRDRPAVRTHFRARGRRFGIWDALAGEAQFTSWAREVEWFIENGAWAAGSEYLLAHILNEQFWSSGGEYELDVEEMGQTIGEYRLRHLLEPFWGTSSIKAYGGIPVYSAAGQTAMHQTPHGRQYHNGTTFAALGASEDLSASDCTALCRAAEDFFLAQQSYRKAGTNELENGANLTVLIRNSTASHKWRDFSRLAEYRDSSSTTHSNIFEGMGVRRLSRLDKTKAELDDDMTVQFILSNAPPKQRLVGYVDWLDPFMDAWESKDTGFFRSVTKRGYGVGVVDPGAIFEVRSDAAPPVGPLQ